MSKHKGFTLIEIIAVITLLGIIAAIVTPVIYNSIEENKQELYDIQLNNIIAGAKNWAADNVFLMPEEGESIVLTLGMLKQGGYVDEDITNPLTDQLFSDQLQVKITKVDNNYNYEIVE